MLSSNGSPYLRPEYLNPPPSTMDSKKSPLALLAQTCSQIGSDPPSSSPHHPSGSSASSSNPPSSSGNKSGGGGAPERKKSVDSSRDKSSPVLSVGSNAGMDLSSKPNKSTESTDSSNNKSSSKSSSKDPSRLTPSRTETAESRRSKSSSPKNHQQQPPPVSGPSQPPSAAPPPPSSMPAYPLMMPTDPMAGYKSLMASPYSFPSPYGYPGPMPGIPGYPGLDLSAYASALKAMPPPPPSLGGYLGLPGAPPSAASSYSAALALQYSRMSAAAAASLSKPPSSGSAGGSNGSEPCRDPYCTGCPNGGGPASSSPPVHMICTAGCGLAAQCDHPKVPVPSSSVSAAGAATTAAPPQKPYVCNWIVGDNYCGKRFGSSDDLLQHLRTHTNLSSSSAPETSSQQAASAVAASLRAAYPTPPLSPLSAARYHPYGKHSAGAGGGPSPFHPGSYPGASAALFHHPAAALMAPYYSHHPHLSLFAPRASLPP